MTKILNDLFFKGSYLISKKLSKIRAEEVSPTMGAFTILTAPMLLIYALFIYYIDNFTDIKINWAMRGRAYFAIPMCLFLFAIIKYIIKETTLEIKFKEIEDSGEYIKNEKLWSWITLLYLIIFFLIGLYFAKFHEFF